MRPNILRGNFKRYAIATFLATAALASFGSGSASAAVMGTLVTWARVLMTTRRRGVTMLPSPQAATSILP